MSFEEMKNELGTDKITYDTETGQRYTYLGAGMSLDSLKPESVLAYSPIVNGHCEVLFADGSVQQMTAGKFAEISQRGLVQTATPQEIAAEQQRQAPLPAASWSARPTAAAPASGPAISPEALSGAGGRWMAVVRRRRGGAIGAFDAGCDTPPVATVAGIRSLRIELPQTGQPFLFTKVLNVSDEPLSIRARIMSLHTFQTIQMVWQTAAFLIGLVVWWSQWRRVNRSTFILTVALMLILGSVCSLLVQWRALHDALIVGFPVVTLAVMAWLVWRYWPRSHQSEPAGAAARRTAGAGSQPAAGDGRHHPAARVWFEHRAAAPMPTIAHRHSAIGNAFHRFRQLLRHGERPRGAVECHAAILFGHPGPDRSALRRRRGGAAIHGQRRQRRTRPRRRRRGGAAQQPRHRDAAGQTAGQDRRRRDQTPARVRHSARVVQPGRARARRVRSGRGFSDGDFVPAHSGQGQDPRGSRGWLRRPH